MTAHQHDFNIANDDGATVRADLNAALAALRSQNNGTTEPASLEVYQLWVDETTVLLKMRNSANSAWITLPISITESNATAAALKVNGILTVIGDALFGNATTGWGLKTYDTLGGAALHIGQAAAGVIDTSKGLTVRRTTGYVGIGELNPGYMLEVAGDISCKSGGRYRFADLSSQNTAGTIVRLHEAKKTDVTALTLPSSFTDVTGLSVSVTPASASSVFKVELVMQAHVTYGSYGLFRLMRDSTPLDVGAASGSRTPCSGMIPGYDGIAYEDRYFYPCVAAVKDSPATTSPIVYKVQVMTPFSAYVRINRSAFDEDSAAYGRAASTLLVTEYIPGVI